MAKTKYKEFFQKMLDNNRELFDEFTKAHNKYQLDQDNNQEEFNEIGRDVQKVIREWEQKLCGRSEGSGYAQYTASLAEKFWAEVRAMYPMVDHIGLETNSFSLKKVSLF